LKGQKTATDGANAVVVTLGSEGCFYKDANHEISVEGFKVNAIDSTAAGMLSSVVC